MKLRRPKCSRVRTIALLTTAFLCAGAASVSPPGQAARAATFVWGAAGDAATLDSAAGLSGFDEEIAWQVFNTLIRLKPGITIALEPDLATSWSVSPDGLVYTFTLRRGVRFQDGTPWNAEAAKFNIDRWADETNPYRPKTGVFLYWRKFVADAFREAQVVDPYTLRLRLKTPSAPMLSSLALPAFGFASPAALRQYGGDGIGHHPVATGPYRFVEWVRADHITLEASPYFFRAGLPKMQRIIFRVIKDNSARLLSLKAREIHAMHGSPDDVKFAQADPNLKIVLGPAFNTGWVHFNMMNRYFSDKRLREAVALAINKQAIVDGLYGGLGEVADQFMPPPMWGRSPQVKAYSYDPERAKKLLAEAGYANGFSTEFWYIPVSRPYFPAGKEIGSAIANDLSRVGIRITLKTEDWAGYLSDTGTLKFPIFMAGWAGDTGDPDNWLGFRFESYHQDRAFASYDSPLVRSLVAKARGLTSQAERAKLYAQIQEIISKDIPIVPIAYSKTVLLMQSNVEGLDASGTGEIRMERVSLR